ncbi:hypothetical protein J6590_001622 [Homalodisca vitripennis]|nr:hypothetical protein J6590_001622 [Homalodisca vitripennis]
MHKINNQKLRINKDVTIDSPKSWLTVEGVVNKKSQAYPLRINLYNMLYVTTSLKFDECPSRARSLGRGPGFDQELTTSANSSEGKAVSWPAAMSQLSDASAPLFSPSPPPVS